jgi:hypothetical protein
LPFVKERGREVIGEQSRAGLESGKPGAAPDDAAGMVISMGSV